MPTDRLTEVTITFKQGPVVLGQVEILFAPKTQLTAENIIIAEQAMEMALGGVIRCHIDVTEGPDPSLAEKMERPGHDHKA